MVLPFLYSDLSSKKMRSATVLSHLKDDDIILCQIANQFVKGKYAFIILNFFLAPLYIGLLIFLNI